MAFSISQSLTNVLWMCKLHTTMWVYFNNRLWNKKGTSLEYLIVITYRQYFTGHLLKKKTKHEADCEATREIESKGCLVILGFRLMSWLVSKLNY